VDLDTESSDVLLLELTSQVTLDEGGLWHAWSVFTCSIFWFLTPFVGRQSGSPYLASATVTDEDELEGRGVLGHVWRCVYAKGAVVGCEVFRGFCGCLGVCCYD
jgi:hypothetical protein